MLLKVWSCLKSSDEATHSPLSMFSAGVVTQPHHGGHQAGQSEH